MMFLNSNVKEKYSDVKNIMAWFPEVINEWICTIYLYF